jgi:hypothetical protein
LFHNSSNFLKIICDMNYNWLRPICFFQYNNPNLKTVWGEARGE